MLALDVATVKEISVRSTFFVAQGFQTGSKLDYDESPAEHHFLDFRSTWKLDSGVGDCDLHFCGAWAPDFGELLHKEGIRCSGR